MYILATKLNMNINDKVSHEATEQVTTFMDGNPSWKYEVPTSLDMTMSTVDETNESLEQFFSRPIRIFTFNWAVGTSIFDSFDPWTLFLWCCWLYFAFAFYDRVCIEFEQAVSVASRLPNLYNVFRNVELDILL